MDVKARLTQLLADEAKLSAGIIQAVSQRDQLRGAIQLCNEYLAAPNEDEDEGEGEKKDGS